MFESNITDDEINKAFEGTNFGSAGRRLLLAEGCLKIVGGYRTGYTLAEIMGELGLIGKTNKLVKKGRMFLFRHYYSKG